jgi:hypothetical protein
MHAARPARRGHGWAPRLRNAAWRGGTLKRLVVLELSEFGRGLLEEQARREHEAVAAVVREAAIYYAADLPLARPAATPPPIQSDGAGPLSRLELEFDLAPETWSTLETVSERRAVSLERVLIHAVLYYVADIESGRLPGRLVGETREAHR